MNHKLNQLKKFQNQIGGKGTMRRTVRKKRKPLRKTHRMTIQEKQYNTIIKQINNYYEKSEKSEQKMLLTTFLKIQINKLFGELKRKDYHKKKVLSETDKITFITENILNKDLEIPLQSNYKNMETTFSKQGINHYNDFMFNVWDLINEKKYII